MKRFFLLYLFFLSFNANAQYFEIPGNGSITPPPGCMAQFYLANYCVEANIVPMRIPSDMPESQAQVYLNKPMGLSCIRAIWNWEGCQRYLKTELENKLPEACRNYWSNPRLKEQNPINQARLQQLAEECGGVR